MNIFASSRNAQVSAQRLDSKRQIKMITESAQILSTVLRYYYKVDNEKLYKATHAKHPNVIWASQNRQNFIWLIKHMQYLAEEYTKKYNKIHKSTSLIPLFKKYRNVLPYDKLSKFANCTKDDKLQLDFRHIADTHFAYQLYVDGKVGKLTQEQLTYYNRWEKNHDRKNNRAKVR